MDEREELLNLNQRLLDSITDGDWETYRSLCDPTLTCFEPEAVGHFVEGLGFHRFYFDLSGGSDEHHNTTICCPHVRLMGNVAVICYVRLIQRYASTGHRTIGFEETRVWEKRNDKWIHVHFHRSRILQQWPLPENLFTPTVR